MQLATTLVHKGAMDIAIHAIRTFAWHFQNTHRLEIHSDGSLDANDELILLGESQGMEARIVRPEERKSALNEALKDHPKSQALLGRGGYFCKLELPITVPKPYFYFDSDIVWLRPVKNLAAPNAASVFSTESWTWYHGMSHDGEWLKERIPRRVNSGFYHLTGEFPHDRLERMLRDRLFDPEKPYNTDQEIMAFLYPDMEYYHPDDLKRSRRGVIHDFATDSAAALHFPGQMWKQHLDQIECLKKPTDQIPMALRFEPAVPLSRMELWRMRTMLKVAESPALRVPVETYRTIRKVLRH